MIDSDLESYITWVPQSSEFYWSTYLSSVKLGHATLADQSALVIFDSGSSAIHLPSADYLRVLDVITAGKNCVRREDLNNSTYCPCNPEDVSDFPDFTFVFGNITIGFEAEYYLVNEGPNGCMVPFKEQGKDMQNIWILGDAFLRSHYTIYDAQSHRIGFVKNRLKPISLRINPAWIYVPLVLFLCCAITVLVTLLRLKSRTKETIQKVIQ